MVAGMPVWPVVGGPLALVAAIGAWWRFMALRTITGAAHSSRPRAWRSLALLGGVVGLAQGSITCLRGLGLPLPPIDWLLPAWAAVTAFEIATALLWVLQGSWERGSRWMVIPMGLAGTLMLASIGAQALAVGAEGMPRFVTALLLLMTAAGGVGGPLLIGDGAGRLAATLCSESLDEETDLAASRGGRTTAD